MPLLVPIALRMKIDHALLACATTLMQRTEESLSWQRLILDLDATYHKVSQRGVHIALLVAAEDDVAIAATFGDAEEETIDHLHELQTPHGGQMIAAEADAGNSRGLAKMWTVNCELVDSPFLPLFN